MSYNTIDVSEGNPNYDPLLHPQLSPDILHAVQMADEDTDAKQFVDCIPRHTPATIRELFHDSTDESEFVEAAFDKPTRDSPKPVPREDIYAYIDETWEVLNKRFDDPPNGSTLLPLPNPHVVAGDRFREAYYWDSYFTAEGLAVDGHLDKVENMVANFAHLVSEQGFIPNGTRAYYTSRSQPPLFYRLVDILCRHGDVGADDTYAPTVEAEREFWMDGAEELNSTEATKRVVSVDDRVLNRYWDERPEPRPESYPHDRRLADELPVSERPSFFRDIRAACESGWDFSSRWLIDAKDMTTVRTTDLIPVDLNAYLYEMERMLGDRIGGNRGQQYRAAAERRREAIEKLCWDADTGIYVDYDWKKNEQSCRKTLATVVPLFTGLASDERAAVVADTLRERFLAEGGLRTTLIHSGQQWDAPHGWPPLHWMAVRGLQRYDHDNLAGEIASRWVATIRHAFEEHDAIFERYNVEQRHESRSDGTYDVQIGFGWTNGVALALEEQADVDLY